MSMKKSIIVFMACICSFSATAYTVMPSREIIHYRYDRPLGPQLQLPQFSTSVVSPQSQFYQHYQQPPTNRRLYPQQRSTTLRRIIPVSSVNMRPAETRSNYASSDSLRLPLPLGMVSIDVGPLPLEEGTASYSSPLTSYGTPYPQKFFK